MALRQDFLWQQYTDASGNKYWDFPLEDTIDPNGKYLPTPYGDSDAQHKIDIIVNALGSIKRFPLLGFNVITRLKSEYDADSTFSDLKEQMKSDGYRVLHGAIIPNPNGGFSIDVDKIENNY